MWAVENQTRFAADRCFVRDIDGAEIWLVAVRATFDIADDGICTPAKNQEPVAMAPQYLQVPGKSSLRCDIDLPRTKPATDVVLNGSACAPNGEPARSVRVSLKVGPIQKSLVVNGTRRWERGVLGIAPTPAEHFITCPISYEKACGGSWHERLGRRLSAWALENPVGVGLETKDGEPAPQIEYPDRPLSGAGTSPAGFGAVAGDWRPRRDLAGTYDDAWRQTRQPLLPLDFQDRYFCTAPADQQTPGFLKGGEDVELTNLTPGGSLRFRLPRLSFGFSTAINGSQTHHRAELHTVLIEPDDMRLIMVWHTALPCHHTLYSLKQTVVFEKERRPSV